jgi:uncharacterized protein
MSAFPMPNAQNKKQNYEQSQNGFTYLKAITIRDSSDVHFIKEDIKKGMILILRVTPLAQKDVDQLRKVVEELYCIAKNTGAEIVRLGEERIIFAPANITIWIPEYDCPQYENNQYGSQNITDKLTKTILNTSTKQSKTNYETPLDILRIRLAKGEITIEEFNKLKLVVK